MSLDSAMQAALRTAGLAPAKLAKKLYPAKLAESRKHMNSEPQARYKYRSLPCSIAADEDIWCIGGTDEFGGSGILEWCYDEADALHRLSLMQLYPHQFSNLSAGPFLKMMTNP